MRDFSSGRNEYGQMNSPLFLIQQDDTSKLYRGGGAINAIVDGGVIDRHPLGCDHLDGLQ